MKKSIWKKPLLWLGVAIIVIALISWFAFPGWRSAQGGFWEMLGVVAVGVLSAAKDVVSLWKELKPSNDESESKPTLEVIATGERSVAVGGDVQGSTITTGDGNEVKLG